MLGKRCVLSVVITYRQIECCHATLLPHSFVVEYAMILTAVGASGMQKDNILIAFARLFVEDLAATPDRDVVEIYISTNDVIDISLRLFISWCDATVCIVDELD